MKRILIVLCMLILSAAINTQAFAQSSSSDKDAEIEALKERVKGLEEQNRAILKLLEEVKARMEPSVRTASLESKPQVPGQPFPSTELREDTDANPAPRAVAESLSSSNQGTDRKKEPVTWGDLFGGDTRIKLYGMVRVDLITDDSRPDNGQIPFFVLSEDPLVGTENAGDFALHPRLTRLGVNFDGPELGSSRLSGQLEVDFQNGGRESRQIIRIRHANFKISQGSFYFLAGQTWDVISPLYPSANNDTLMWNAGNLGDRRPQLRVGYEPKVGDGQWSFVGAAGLTGAIDALDLDANGIRDGEESQLPNIEARIGYAHASWVEGQRASFGVWGHRGWEDTTTRVAGKTEFRSQSLGLDYSVPLAARVLVKGEAWFGRNLSDVRGGIGQGINTSTGDAVRSRGGWVEAAFKAHKYLTIVPGFTIDDPRDEDIVSRGRIRNRAWYVTNRINLGGGFLLGADYLRWITDYKNLLRGTDNRFNLFLQYGF